MDLIRRQPASYRGSRIQGVLLAPESAITRILEVRCSVHQGRTVIAVVDYSVSNLSSVVRALALPAHEARLRPIQMSWAGRLVLPGVAISDKVSATLAERAFRTRSAMSPHQQARTRHLPGLQLLFPERRKPRAPRGWESSRKGDPVPLRAVAPHVGWAVSSPDRAGQTPSGSHAALSRWGHVLLSRSQLPSLRSRSRHGAGSWAIMAVRSLRLSGGTTFSACNSTPKNRSRRE
jgi:hypothetical protein